MVYYIYEVRYFDSENFALTGEREVGSEKFKNVALSEHLSFKCCFIHISLRPTYDALASFKVG